MTTKRKAYVRPMPSTWWKNLPFYRFYMLREGTAVPAVWFQGLAHAAGRSGPARAVCPAG
jgi:fumarate reductase subunit C